MLIKSPIWLTLQSRSLSLGLQVEKVYNYSTSKLQFSDSARGSERCWTDASFKKQAPAANSNYGKRILVPKGGPVTARKAEKNRKRIHVTLQLRGHVASEGLCFELDSFKISLKGGDGAYGKDVLKGSLACSHHVVWGK